MYNIFFTFFSPSFSLFSHSQKPLSHFWKKWVSLRNIVVAATPNLQSLLPSSRCHENHLLPQLSSSNSKSDLGIILRIWFGYYLTIVSFSDLIWGLFFVRFSLETPRVKMGMKRLLVFFIFLFVGMNRLWRWICVCGGFESCRREGGVWAVLGWWFWRLMAWGCGVGCARLVVLKIADMRVGCGLCCVLLSKTKRITSTIFFQSLNSLIYEKYFLFVLSDKHWLLGCFTR